MLSGDIMKIDVQCGAGGFGRRSWSQVVRGKAMGARLRRLALILQATRSQKQVQSGSHCESSSDYRSSLGIILLSNKILESSSVVCLYRVGVGLLPRPE